LSANACQRSQQPGVAVRETSVEFVGEKKDISDALILCERMQVEGRVLLYYLIIFFYTNTPQVTNFALVKTPVDHDHIRECFNPIFAGVLLQIS
jgi:hypothetical protein